MLKEIDRLLQFYEGGAITRRQLLARLVAVHGAGTGIVRQATNGAFTGRNINHVTLSVADVARSVAFYRKLLGATPLTTYPEGTDLRVGNGFIGIYSLDRSLGGAGAPSSRDYPPRRCSVRRRAAPARRSSNRGTVWSATPCARAAIRCGVA